MTHLVVLDDLGDEVARAQVIRKGHSNAQDAHVGKALEHLPRYRRGTIDRNRKRMDSSTNKYQWIQSMLLLLLLGASIVHSALCKLANVTTVVHTEEFL